MQWDFKNITKSTYKFIEKTVKMFNINSLLQYSIKFNLPCKKLTAFVKHLMLFLAYFVEYLKLSDYAACSLFEQGAH